MTSYFDNVGSRVTSLERRIAAATDGYDDEVQTELTKLEESLVWDVTLTAEWPGCPSEIRDAIHVAVLRYAPSAYTNGGGPDYETQADYARALGEMSSRLHDVFHDLARLRLDGFSDAPKTPLVRLFSVGDERRDRMTPPSLKWWKAQIEGYDAEDRESARARIAMRAYDYERSQGVDTAGAIAVHAAAGAFLRGEGPEPSLTRPKWERRRL
jgi:hypothetical protein